MKKLIYTTGLLIIITFAACSKITENSLNATDRSFTLKTSQGNAAEVDAGMLAAAKAINPQVKKFGQFMIMEHQTAQTDLMSLASTLNIILHDPIDTGHANIMAKLRSLPAGRAFDSTYMYTQVMDHDMTLANFQNEIDNGNHGALKAYANNYLPHIQMHRQSADSIARAYFKR